ncbi:unnamed protein product [Gordionus sp. m RMFG-2023]
MESREKFHNQRVWPPVHYTSAVQAKLKPLTKLNPNALNSVKYSYSGGLQAYNSKAMRVKSQVVKTTKFNEKIEMNNGMQITKGVKDMELEENIMLKDDDKFT